MNEIFNIFFSRHRIKLCITCLLIPTVNYKRCRLNSTQTSQRPNPTVRFKFQTKHIRNIKFTKDYLKNLIHVIFFESNPTRWEYYRIIHLKYEIFSKNDLVLSFTIVDRGCKFWWILDCFTNFRIIMVNSQVRYFIEGYYYNFSIFFKLFLFHLRGGPTQYC